MKSTAQNSKFGLTARIIAWFLIISIVPILIVGVSVYNQSVNTITANLNSSLEALTFSRGPHIEDVLVSSLDQVKAVVELDQFQNNLSNIVEGIDVEESTLSLQEAIDDVNNETNTFFSITITDAQGNYIADTDQSRIGTTVFDARDKDWFDEGLKDFYISDAEETNNGVAVIEYSGSIITDESDESIGVLKIAQAFERELNGEIGSEVGVGINSIVEATEGLGETGEVYLVNKDKLMITPSRTLGSNDTYLQTIVDTEGYKNCFLEGSALVAYDNYAGKSVVGNAEPIKGTEWCIIAEFEVAEAFQPIKDLRNNIAVISVLVIIGVILVAFVAAKNIGDFIKTPIKTAADLLGKTSIALSASTQQASAASQHNASIAQQVANAAITQSEKSTNVVGVMSQMTASIRQMGVSMTAVTKSAEDAATVAKEAGQSGEQSKQTLSKMRDVIANSTTMVKEVANKSQSISTIVKTITEIAEQTNLLSLNASIEAARAGEAGRGFAVVATEVKNLSEEAKKSASEIGNLVKEMLANIDETVTASEESNRTVDESTKIIGDTLSKLQTITTSMLDVSDKIQEVSVVIQEQSSATDNVGVNMGQVSELAQQSASGAQQLSASVQQQSAINQQVAAASQQLLSLSVDLQNLVGEQDSTSDVSNKPVKQIAEPVVKKEPKIQQMTVAEPTPTVQNAEKIEIKKIG